LPRVVLLAIALTVSAGIPLAISTPASAQQPTNVLFAGDVAGDSVHLPPTTTSVLATDVQNGNKFWFSTIGNYTQTPVTNAAVSIMSGYDPSLFDSVTSFPVIGTTASIAPSQGWLGPSLNPVSEQNPGALSVSYSLGYDSTRTVSPSVIPAGGGQQTVTMTLTPVDAEYGPQPNRTVNFDIFISSPLPGVTVASFTNPGNLDQGETLQTGSNSFAIFHWDLGAPVLGKQYTFTATLNVPNTSGMPFEYRPLVQFAAGLLTTVCDGCPGSSVTVKDPTLDGNAPGSGAMTFSVDQTSDTWVSQHGDSFFVFYDGTTQTPAFNFTGFFPPVGNPPTINTVKAGSAIPVKFSLGGNQGLNILAPGSPSSSQIACATGTPLDAIETTVTAGGSSLSYDPTTGQYVYVWKTNKAWAGTCRQLDVQLSDGTDHLADFEFH